MRRIYFRLLLLAAFLAGALATYLVRGCAAHIEPPKKEPPAESNSPYAMRFTAHRAGESGTVR